MANTEKLRTRIQSEIEAHLAIVKKLREKIALVDQVEKLSVEFDSASEGCTENGAAEPLPQEVTPETKAPETQPVVANPAVQAGSTEPAAQEPMVIEDSLLAGNNPYAFLHQGFQAYLAGKPDKAIELFRQARALNPSQFEKSWTNMTAIPIYTRVVSDKYLQESLFLDKVDAPDGGR